MPSRILSSIIIVAFIILTPLSNSYSRTVMAWIAASDIDVAYMQLQKHYGIKEAINVLGLQFWLPNGSGGLKYSEDYDPTDPDITRPSDAAVTKLTKFAHANGIKVFLCLYNCVDVGGTPTWDWNLAKSAFKTNPAATITALVNKMEALGLDGIDLDLEGENVGTDGKTEYISFATSLYSAVHAKNKLLSVCTYASDYGSPGTGYWSSLKNCTDHIMCMGYAESGYNSGITYASLASIGGLSSGVLCLGVNADASSTWLGQSASYHLNGIAGMNNVGLAIWTVTCKGAGAWIDPATWNIVKQISNKTVTYDTTNASPNLVPYLTFSGNTDDNSTATANVAGGVMTAELNQGGTVDDGYWCNVIGHSPNDFKDVKWIKITYTSTKPFTLQLYQESLDTLGECFKDALPAASSYTTKVLNVNTFFQPWWGETNATLDMSKVNGITCDPELEGMGITTIKIKEIVCYGRTSWSLTPIAQPNVTVPQEDSRFGLVMQANAVSYSIPSDGHYTIAIYRANGSCVRTVVDKNMTRGTYQIDNIARGLSKGMYLVNLKGAQGSTVCDLVVQK